MDHHRWGCGLPCPREFSDSAGLARHRRACHHYKHRLDLQAQNFKRRAREDPKHTKVFKRMKPSDETQTTVLSSSSSHPESILNPTSPILDQSRSIAPSPSTNNLIDSNQTTSPGSPPQDPSDVPDFTNHDSRPRRILRLPLRYRDELPQAPLPVAQDQPNSHPTRVILHVFDSIRTCFNTFSIARQYRHRPSYDPD
ncbi:uncharacterized protein HD556DRAFT_1448805 [Suillus plorans]|uniref:C2H2-type domain-containing protein n=1 Tax=Suillus plorans TaxID=116603 RepID=A0A9P7AFC5_9AGAM|nr:uncharacterized protein HD556DRAFT_1448805 [Suillus plorans]KAG1787318.1 hypothetical protein HD556DRAFT_1448805 [Suillus plorans]